MDGLRDRSRCREARQQANTDVYAEWNWLIIITDFQDGLDVCQEEGNVSESVQAFCLIISMDGSV